MADTLTASGRLAPGSALSRGLFAYAAIVVGGSALWWGSTFHAASMPVWGPFDFSWLWFIATTLTLFWYGRGLAAMTPAERPPAWRVATFLAGVALIYAVLQTRFEYLAQHMFFLNRAQHLAMHHLGPFLIALAWPRAVFGRGMPPALLRLLGSRPVRIALRIVQEPLLASLLFVGLIALWLWPPIHFRAMIDPRLYAFMNWTMVVDGVLFWCLVLDPRPAPPAYTSFGARAAVAIAIMFPQIAMGAALTFVNHDIYPFYAWCGRFFPAIGAVEDQKYGGLIVWIPAAMMSVVGLLVVINALRLTEEAESENRSEEEEDDEGLVISSAAWTGR